MRGGESMNCKKGDLAVTVALSNQTSEAAKRNAGRLVDVVRFVGRHEFGCGRVGVDVWLCELLGGPVVAANGVSWRGRVFICDVNLRPIRDNPGEDETLQWAPVPGQTAPA